MRFIVIIIYFFSFLANCHEYKNNNIFVDHPILKVSSEEAKVGAGYFRVVNDSDQSIYLKKIVSDICQKLEIHEVIRKDNMYKMRPINKDLMILSGKELIFKAKSYHAMFFNFNKTIKNNDMIKASLHFRKGIIIPIEFKVIMASSQHSHH